jgi:hypothetical protein
VLGVIHRELDRVSLGPLRVGAAGGSGPFVPSPRCGPEYASEPREECR